MSVCVCICVCVVCVRACVRKSAREKERGKEKRDLVYVCVCVGGWRGGSAEGGYRNSWHESGVELCAPIKIHQLSAFLRFHVVN